MSPNRSHQHRNHLDRTERARNPPRVEEKLSRASGIRTTEKVRVITRTVGSAPRRPRPPPPPPHPCRALASAWWASRAHGRSARFADDAAAAAAAAAMQETCAAVRTGSARLRLSSSSFVTNRWRAKVRRDIHESFHGNSFASVCVLNYSRTGRRPFVVFRSRVVRVRICWWRCKITTNDV